MTDLLSRVPESVRRRADSPWLWLLIAYVGLAFVIGWLWFVRGDVNREQSIRESSAQSNYGQCVASIPLLTKINAEFRAAEVVGQTIIQNALLTHAITPSGSPMYRQQIHNIARLAMALNEGGVRVPVPTLATCAANRDRTLRG